MRKTDGLYSPLRRQVGVTGAWWEELLAAYHPQTTTCSPSTELRTHQGGGVQLRGQWGLYGPQRGATVLVQWVVYVLRMRNAGKWGGGAISGRLEIINSLDALFFVWNLMKAAWTSTTHEEYCKLEVWGGKANGISQERYAVPAAISNTLSTQHQPRGVVKAKACSARAGVALATREQVKAHQRP